LKVADREVVLPAAFGELLLVVEQVGFVDRCPARASLRGTARLDDAASLAFFAGPVRGGDLYALLWRFGLLAPNKRDDDHPYPVE
jgi:hypothetical protein